jgi:putative ABC transport system permease protein
VNSALPWRIAWRIARRDLSARFRGLRLLLVCLVLGVGAIAAIGTLTGSIERELEARGTAILGGDVEVEVWQRGLTGEERTALAKLGTLSEGTRMQAMASARGESAPVALKAVDSRWPMVGRLTLRDGRKVGSPPPGVTWLAPGTAERLALRKGDSVVIGGETLRVGGIIADEPDRLSEGFSLGSTAIVEAAMPARAGLTSPGAMYRTKARLVLDGGRDPQAVVDTLKARFPDAGFDYRTRDKASPGTERFVSRMGEFLTLVGLAALAIAGIGIAGGVSSYLEARGTGIATLKVLGATSGDAARIYLLQIAAASLVGAAGGLAIGVLVTPLLARALGDLLPVTPGFVFDPLALARAAAFGLLVALVSAAPALLRARAFPAMALMRVRVAPLTVPLRQMLLPIGGGMAGIAALAFAGARQPAVTASFLAGALGALLLLGLLGMGIARAAARLPRPSQPLLRAALANLHRPGAQTPALVTALGFGLSTFVLLAAVQSSLDANIERRVPDRAPDYFVLDVPKDGAAQFRQTVLAQAPEARVRLVPALRGAILAFGPEGAMTRVADMESLPDGAWQLRGERGLTYSAAVPEGNVVTEGRWWRAGHAGPPLVSVDEELAEAIGLKIGDKLTVGLLGVERTVTVASFRRIDWDSLGFNYVLVFSPDALADAPHNLAATIELPEGANPPSLLRTLVRAFPSSSVIEIGAVLKEARGLLSQMSLAILAAASVAGLAGLAVLVGAIAAARASRTYDTVILRVLGASRRQVLLMQMAEYAVLSALLSLVALALGSAVGWAIVVQLFDFDWLPDWPRVLAVLAGAVAFILAVALAGSLPLLRAKPAQALREL